MGLTIKNKNTFELTDDLASIFSLPIEETKEDYQSLKEDIYSLKIDNEEKANIINKINKLSTIKNIKEKKKIIEEIEEFKYNYNI